MALPKKKSRAIIVDNEEYRYSITTTQIDDKWNFSLNLIVQTEHGQGALLKSEGLVTRNIWLDFSDHKQYHKNDYPVIRPSDISKIITFAIKKGWTPNIKGSSFLLQLDNSYISNSEK